MYDDLMEALIGNDWADDDKYDLLIWELDHADGAWADDQGYDEANPDY